MKRFARETLFAAVAFGLGLTVAGISCDRNVNDPKKPDSAAKTVHAADLADAFAKDPKKASRDFDRKLGRPMVEITGRVTNVAMSQALLTNVDSEVRVYVSLGNEKARIGDLINATVKTLKYDADEKNLVVESDIVRIAAEDSGTVPQPFAPPKKKMTPRYVD